MLQLERIHGGRDFLGQLRRAIVIGSRQHDRKLFAAKARDKVPRAAGHGLDCFTDFDQASVTGLVSKGVVVAAKVVDVDYQHREGGGIA